MNLFRGGVDPEADTSPPFDESDPFTTSPMRRGTHRRQFVLIAIAVPMVALMVGVAAGALAALL